MIGDITPNKDNGLRRPNSNNKVNRDGSSQKINIYDNKLEYQNNLRIKENVEKFKNSNVANINQMKDNSKTYNQYYSNTPTNPTHNHYLENDKDREDYYSNDGGNNYY